MKLKGVIQLTGQNSEKTRRSIYETTICYKTAFILLSVTACNQQSDIDMSETLGKSEDYFRQLGRNLWCTPKVRVRI